MIRKPLKTNLQLLIYDLYWNTKIIKKLKKDLVLTKDDDEIYLINGNLSECKQDRVFFLRKINSLKKYKKQSNLF